MLAQNFKTSADLGITDPELDALIKVLGMLERGEIDEYHFDMREYQAGDEDCGTVGCICGWAYEVSDKRAFENIMNPRPLAAERPYQLMRLFADSSHIRNGSDPSINADWKARMNAKPPHAALALRSYLTTGEPNWADALASA